MRRTSDPVAPVPHAALDGHHSAAIRLYDVDIGHVTDMADMLRTGIMEQFPARFR